MIAIFPEIIAAATKSDIELLSILIRRYYCHSRAGQPRINLRNICEDIGIKIQTLAIRDFATLVAKDETGSFRVNFILNDEERSLESENFLLAHLLGHFLLHVQPKIARGDWMTSGFREKLCPLSRYSLVESQMDDLDQDSKLESAADQFAAALILPKAMLLRAKEKLVSVERIGIVFKTTTGVVKRRLSNLEQDVKKPNSFTEAETKLQMESPKTQLKNLDRPGPSQKSKDRLRSDNTSDSKIRMPRSVAASSYGKTAVSTQSPQTPVEGGKAQASADVEDQALLNQAEQGLAKLRRLARKIDKSID